MNASTWILGIIIIVLIILAVIFLILWLANNGKVNTQNSQLSINDLKFSLKDTSTVEATWSSVGNPGNEVILYADTFPINFNASGQPEDNVNIKTSSKVNGSTKVISLSGLTPNTKYYLAVNVTNPKFTGFNSNPGLIYTGEIPASSFIIQEINTPGAISLDVNNNTTITYEKTINKTEVNDIWLYNPKNFTLSTRGVGSNSNKIPTLYNNNGILASQDLSVLEKESNFNSIAQWEYDRSNRWCLKNSPNVCMHLDVPAANSSSIKLIENSKTQWINLPLSTDFILIPRNSTSTNMSTTLNNCTNNSSKCFSDSSKCFSNSSKCFSKDSSKFSKDSSKFSKDSSKFSKDSSKFSKDSDSSKSYSDDSSQTKETKETKENSSIQYFKNCKFSKGKKDVKRSLSASNFTTY